MVLHNVQLYGKKGTADIHIRGGAIHRILHNPGTDADPGSAPLLLPGLINSHDHLDFNCYPQLGCPLYRHYTEWGKEIQTGYRAEINAVNRIPELLRVQWGLYRNLLNGFTTVVSHGKNTVPLPELIRVMEYKQDLHSVAFEKNWVRKLNNPLRTRQPVVMHIGEGAGGRAAEECRRVQKANILGRKIIAVHGIGMEPQLAGAYAGLVWCPASNFFMFGKTAAVKSLMKHTAVVFGTDSTLTSPYNAWEHFRKALQGSEISPEELLHMLTVQAARLWNLPRTGTVADGMQADLLMLRNTNGLFTADPGDILLVMVNGMVKLCDDSLRTQYLPEAGQYSPVDIQGHVKWVEGDLPGLIRRIRNIYPELASPLTPLYEQPV